MTHEDVWMSDIPVDQTGIYLKTVKQRLKMRREELAAHYSMDLVIDRLSNVVQKRYGIRTTPSKLKAMFDPEDPRTVPLAELVAVCDILGLSLADVTAMPVQNHEEFSVWRKESGQPRKLGVAALENKYYEGRYYCYYYRPKKFRGHLVGEQSENEVQPIWQGELNIRREGERTRATFIESNNTYKFDSSGILKPLVLTGDVYLLPNMNQVYTTMSDHGGNRHMSLMFNYYNLVKDVLYYKTASLLTVSVNQYRRPVFQKLVMFRTPLDLSDSAVEEVLRGMLSMNHDEFMVEKEKYDTIMAEYKDLDSQLDKDKKTFYVFQEQSLFNKRTSMDYTRKVELILKLKSASTAAALEVFEEPEEFAQYARKLQERKI